MLEFCRRIINIIIDNSKTRHNIIRQAQGRRNNGQNSLGDKPPLIKSIGLSNPL